MTTQIRKVIAEAMHEAYRYDASGPNSEDILDALEKAGYVIVKQEDRCCASCDGHACDDRTEPDGEWYARVNGLS